MGDLRRHRVRSGPTLSGRIITWLLIGVAQPLRAQHYGFPTSSDDYAAYTTTAYFAQSHPKCPDCSGENACDWNCGCASYVGINGLPPHRGTDFAAPMGQDVTAAASGIVTRVSLGCPDTGACSTCGGSLGNHVVVNHPSGDQSVYAHLRQDSIAVATGERVTCGQKLALSGASGCVTGAHLHFEHREGGTTARDPFDGTCSDSVSRWSIQGGVFRPPIPTL